jgi:hypothetical protein
MHRRIAIRADARILPLVGASAAAAAAAWGVKLLVSGVHPLLSALLTLGTYGVVYLGLTAALGIPEMRLVVDRLRRLARRDS